MSGLRDSDALSGQLRAAYDAKVENVLRVVTKRIGLEAFTRVVQRSPVGNPSLWKEPDNVPPGYVGGRFRANWQLGVGTRPDGTLDAIDSGGLGSPPAAMDKALGELGKLNESLDTIYVVNNLPYAERLENGHSTQQAPQGMVEITAAELRGAAAQIVKSALEGIGGRLV